jgi:tryptophan synthase alpha chain
VPESNSGLHEAFAGDPALVPYVAAGDPEPEATPEYVRALARGGADAIELGMPFSEPIAEGPTIQNAVFRALDAGMTPDVFFEMVDDLDVDVPLLVMTYYNPIYQYGRGEGPAPFVERAAEAGLSGIIVPDLPVDESGPLRRACDEYGLDLVLIVAPTTADERLDRVMDRVSGFAYVQARTGTTGARTDLSEQTFDSLDRLDGYDVPKAVGFGVSEPEHAEAIVEGGADGVVVGSALVDIIAEETSAGSQTESGDIADGHEEGASTAEVADRLETKVRALKRGALAGADRAESVPEPEGS